MVLITDEEMRALDAYFDLDRTEHGKDPRHPVDPPELDDDTRRRFAEANGVTPDRVSIQYTISRGYVPWIDWTTIGREHYYDAPDSMRDQVVSGVVRRSVHSRFNETPWQFHEGVLLEHRAHCQGLALGCGKSIYLHDALKCACGARFGEDACPCALCEQRRAAEKP